MSFIKLAHQRGLSMVELLVSIFIGLAVLGGAGSVFLTSLRGESDNARVTRLNCRIPDDCMVS